MRSYDRYNIVDSFMTYVKPEYGMIMTLIQKLTGITKKDVADAPMMKEALRAFAEWLPEDVTLVAWSDNDRVQIQREREYKEIDFGGIDKLYGEWIDCQKTFSEIVRNPKHYNLVEAMNLSDIDYDENIHDGLVDARNTALLFRKMQTEEVFQFNKYYKMMIDEDQEYEQIGA